MIKDNGGFCLVFLLDLFIFVYRGKILGLEEVSINCLPKVN